jgi:hypothetical protein
MWNLKTYIIRIMHCTLCFQWLQFHLNCTNYGITSQKTTKTKQNYINIYLSYELTNSDQNYIPPRILTAQITKWTHKTSVTTNPNCLPILFHY